MKAKPSIEFSPNSLQEKKERDVIDENERSEKKEISSGSLSSLSDSDTARNFVR